MTEAEAARCLFSLSLSHSIIFVAESEEGKRSLDETLVAKAITVIKIVARRED